MIAFDSYETWKYQSALERTDSYDSYSGAHFYFWEGIEFFQSAYWGSIAVIACQPVLFFLVRTFVRNEREAFSNLVYTVPLKTHWKG